MRRILPLLLLLGLLLYVPRVKAQEPASREPIPLALYPRPLDDNGWGMHFSPAAGILEPEVVDLFVHELESLGMKWTLVLNDGLKPHKDELIQRLVAVGIEPVLRIYTPYNDPLPTRDLISLVRHYKAMGVHYFQLYNEPNLEAKPGGWREGEAISVTHMVDVWLPAARAVQAAGGIPTTPPLAPGGDYDDMAFFREFLDEIKARKAEHIFMGVRATDGSVRRYGAVINLHNYGLGHPPTYPDDPVSETGQAVSGAELQAYQLPNDAVAQSVNNWRAQEQGALQSMNAEQDVTILEDSNGFRKYEAYLHEFTSRFGFEVPLLATEGGWTLGEQADKRYLPVTPAIQAAWTEEAYACMVEPGCVPEAAFVYMTWIIADTAANGGGSFEHQALYLKRCWTNTAPEGVSAHLSQCQEEDVLPVVWDLADSPLKGAVRQLPALQSPWAAQMEPAEATELRADITLTASGLRMREETWDRIAALAVEMESTAEGVLAALYPERVVGEPQVEVRYYEMSLDSDDVRVSQEGNEATLTNLTDDEIPIHYDGRVQNIPPRGSLTLVVPEFREVVVPAAAPAPPHDTRPATPTATPRASASPTTWPAPTPIQWQSEAARTPPSDAWSSSQVRPLSAWPRPPHDTGLGLHYTPIGDVSEAEFRQFIADIQAMHMTWATVLYSSEDTLRVAAPLFRDAGIMVNWRPFLRGHDSYPEDEIARDLAILRDAGMPPYIQLYNEPELGVEWEESDIRAEERDEHFISSWLSAADAVWRHGGFPGIQLLDPDLLAQLLTRVRAEKPYLLNDLYFVAHSYGSNHPPAYPYDPINQSTHPGATTREDWTAVLGFQRFAQVFEEQVGFVPPIIIGEGGWTVGVLEDARYPRIDASLHREYHLEMADWFRTGKLSNGEALPDELFAATFWLYKQHRGGMDFAADAWYESSLNGTLTATIEGFRNLPPFTRPAPR